MVQAIVLGYHCSSTTSILVLGLLSSCCVAKKICILYHHSNPVMVDHSSLDSRIIIDNPLVHDLSNYSTLHGRSTGIEWLSELVLLVGERSEPVFSHVICL